MSDYLVKEKAMICASADAEERTYKKFIDKQSRIWLVANQVNEGDNIYVEGGSNSEGFGGRTLEFKTIEGEILHLKGPWATNSEDLLKSTGYDIRDKHFTFVVISEGRANEGYNTIMKDVLYQDKDWTLGKFSRGDELAEKMAQERGKMVMLYSESRNGSANGPVYPMTYKHLSFTGCACFYELNHHKQIIRKIQIHSSTGECYKFKYTWLDQRKLSQEGVYTERPEITQEKFDSLWLLN